MWTLLPQNWMHPGREGWVSNRFRDINWALRHSHSRHGTSRYTIFYPPSPSLCLLFSSTVSLSNSFRISLPLRYLYRTHIRERQHGLCRRINYRFYISYFKREAKRNRPRHHRRHYNAMPIYMRYTQMRSIRNRLPYFPLSIYPPSPQPFSHPVRTLTAISLDVVVLEANIARVHIHTHTHTHKDENTVGFEAHM